eukprot:jgi/Bigna1/142464/aug1.70_g17172
MVSNREPYRGDRFSRYYSSSDHHRQPSPDQDTETLASRLEDDNSLSSSSRSGSNSPSIHPPMHRRRGEGGASHTDLNDDRVSTYNEDRSGASFLVSTPKPLISTADSESSTETIISRSSSNNRSKKDRAARRDSSSRRRRRRGDPHDENRGGGGGEEGRANSARAIAREREAFSHSAASTIRDDDSLEQEDGDEEKKEIAHRVAAIPQAISSYEIHHPSPHNHHERQHREQAEELSRRKSTRGVCFSGEGSSVATRQSVEDNITMFEDILHPEMLEALNQLSLLDYEEKQFTDLLQARLAQKANALSSDLAEALEMEMNMRGFEKLKIVEELRKNEHEKNNNMRKLIESTRQLRQDCRKLQRSLDVRDARQECNGQLISNTDLYDWIVDIDLLSQLSDQGWRVSFSKNFMDAKNQGRDGREGAVVAVMGLYDKGKTFVLNQITSANLPSGKKDSAGSYSPVKVTDEFSVAQKEATELFLTQSSKSFKEIIVVHNLKEITHERVLDHIWKTQGEDAVTKYIRPEKAASKSDNEDDVKNSIFRLPQIALDATGLMSARPDSYLPPVDVIRRDQEYRILMDIPGMTKSDITLNRQNVISIIKGRRVAPYDPSKVAVLKQERRYGEFTMTYRIPESYERKWKWYDVKDGVLTVVFEADNEDEKVPIHPVNSKDCGNNFHRESSNVYDNDASHAEEIQAVDHNCDEYNSAKACEEPQERKGGNIQQIQEV